MGIASDDLRDSFPVAIFHAQHFALARLSKQPIAIAPPHVRHIDT